MTKEEKIIEVERLRKEIYNSIKKNLKWNGIFVEVKVTKEAVSGKKTPIEAEVILTKSKTMIYFLLVIMIALLASNFIAVNIAGVLFVLPVGALIAVLIFNGRGVAEKIIINNKGIICDGITTDWGNIFQTFVVKEPIGRYMQTFLWIALYNGDHLKIEISSFAYRNIGSIIEKYKRIYIDDQVLSMG
jgi:hypothetical protein